MREEKNAPRISTHFYIAGWDLDPDVCTVEVGLEPTDIWHQKHIELRAREDIPSVSWNLRRVRNDSHSVSEAVDEVLDLIWGSRERVKAFVNGKKVVVGVACSVTIEFDRPVYDLSVNAIRRLADLGCEFTLDITDYSELPQAKLPMA